jgi:biotin carboxylase
MLLTFGGAALPLIRTVQEARARHGRYRTSMTRILLVLSGGSYRAGDFVRAAAHLGAEVVVATDLDAALPGLTEGRVVGVPLADPSAAAESIVAFARRTPLDAVVAADDGGVEAAALAAARLDLPHSRPGAVSATRDKERMRARLDAADVAQPAWLAAPVEDDVSLLARRLGGPFVLKPVSLSASRGVIRVDDRLRVAAAASRVRRILPCAGADARDTLLLERYVEGDEVAIEGLMRGGRLEVLAFFDKPDPLEGPYFEETIYTTPSRLPATTQERVIDAVTDATKAIGLDEGPIHAEARLAPDGPVVLEVAARSIGGLCARALTFGSGIGLDEVVLRHAAGLAIDDLTSASAASGVMMLPIPHAGVLREVRGQERARQTPGIAGLEITIPPGRMVHPLPEADRYLGFLFAHGPHPAVVELSLRQAHAELEVVIDPVG